MHSFTNILITILVFMGVLMMPVQGQFFYDEGNNTNVVETTNIGDTFEQYTTEDTGLFVRIMQLFGVYSFTNNGNNTDGAISYVNYVTNILLGLAAFIASLFLIYAFYLIFFSKDEEGFENAKKIITGIVIAILIMGSAWVIVSFLFYIYTLIQ